jgi:hypothetical protein
MKRTLIALSLLIASPAFAADKASPQPSNVIKTKDLPALKGGKAKAERKFNDGIPQCFSETRLAVTNEDDYPALLDWAATHQDHVCYGAPTLYVCRAGRRLSVRCE